MRLLLPRELSPALVDYLATSPVTNELIGNALTSGVTKLANGLVKSLVHDCAGDHCWADVALETGGVPAARVVAYRYTATAKQTEPGVSIFIAPGWSVGYERPLP